MARSTMTTWVFDTVAISVSLARPGHRGLSPEVIALMLRMTLPVAPKLSDMLVAMQAGGHWHHLIAGGAA